MPPVARVCSIPACGRVHYSKGYCRRCYEALQEDAPRAKVTNRVRRICTIDGCGQPWHGLERCKRHYAALIREQARKYREHVAGNVSKRGSSRKGKAGEAA